MGSVEADGELEEGPGSAANGASFMSTSSFREGGREILERVEGLGDAGRLRLLDEDVGRPRRPFTQSLQRKTVKERTKMSLDRADRVAYARHGGEGKNTQQERAGARLYLCSA